MLSASARQKGGHQAVRPTTGCSSGCQARPVLGYPLFRGQLHISASGHHQIPFLLQARISSFLPSWVAPSPSAGSRNALMATCQPLDSAFCQAQEPVPVSPRPLRTGLVNHLLFSRSSLQQAGFQGGALCLFPDNSTTKGSGGPTSFRFGCFCISFFNC